MLLIRWAPVAETERIPPFGDALRARLEGRRGAVRYASCSAWGLLFSLLQEKGLSPGTVVFSEKGKPGFADIPLFFSLSHSGDVCAAALSDLPVGVDIERCARPVRPGLAERSMTAAEKEAFDGDFIRLWCRKEALAKMTGEGIVGYPSDLDTSCRRFTEQKVSFGGESYWLTAVCGDREENGAFFSPRPKETLDNRR